MNPSDYVGIIVGILTVSTILLAGLIWLIRAQTALNKEFKPNGGKSTRDIIDRIETDLRDIRVKLDDHIEWHLDR